MNLKTAKRLRKMAAFHPNMGGELEKTEQGFLRLVVGSRKSIYRSMKRITKRGKNA